MTHETFAPWAEIVPDAPLMTAEQLAARPDGELDGLDVVPVGSLLTRLLWRGSVVDGLHER